MMLDSWSEKTSAFRFGEVDFIHLFILINYFYGAHVILVVHYVVFAAADRHTQVRMDCCVLLTFCHLINRMAALLDNLNSISKA